MPFDAAVDNPALARAVLKEALRLPMPEDFTWDFGQCHSENGAKKHCGAVGCAMGLAFEMGLAAAPFTYSLGPILGMSRLEAHHLFTPSCGPISHIIAGPYYRGMEYERVTPSMVADAIEEWEKDNV